MTNAKDVLRMLESLALMTQDSAETGNLDTSVYADIAELIRNLTTIIKNLIGGDDA